MRRFVENEVTITTASNSFVVAEPYKKVLEILNENTSTAKFTVIEIFNLSKDEYIQTNYDVTIIISKIEAVTVARSRETHTGKK